MKLAERIRRRMIDDPPATGIRHIVMVRLIMAGEIPRQLPPPSDDFQCSCAWCTESSEHWVGVPPRSVLPYRGRWPWPCSCRYLCVKVEARYVETINHTLIPAYGLGIVSWFEIHNDCPQHGDDAYEARLPPWVDRLLAEDGEL